MDGGPGESGRQPALESGDAVEHESDDVPPAPLEIFGVLQRHAHGGGDGTGVDQVEPAERDDAEQELRGLARGRVVEPQLRADRGQRFLARGEMAELVMRRAAAQGLALDQPDEIRSAGEKAEVVGDGAGEDGLGGLAARQSAGPAGTDGLPDCREAALEDGLIELGLGAEEVPGGAAGDAGSRADLAQAGTLEALLRKQLFRGVQNGGAGAVRVALSLGGVRQRPSGWLACRSASYGPDPPRQGEGPVIARRRPAIGRRRREPVA
jgi:hypothetical protein